MKNALFFPFSLLAELGDPTQQIRPYTYDSSSNSISYSGGGDVPNARGGTCPEMGFQVAYNQFSRQRLSGRRGASKVAIFETDGVPNSLRLWDAPEQRRIQFVLHGRHRLNCRR